MGDADFSLFFFLSFNALINAYIWKYVNMTVVVWRTKSCIVSQHQHPKLHLSQYVCIVLRLRLLGWCVLC